MLPNRPCIAVINDDSAITELFSQFLEEEGYTTVCSLSDNNSYQMIRDSQPDLVLLDLQMEHRDSGLRVLDLTRLDPTTAHIPVIMLSADGAFLRDKESHLAQHNCAILEKPVQLHELLAKVHKIIGPPPLL